MESLKKSSERPVLTEHVRARLEDPDYLLKNDLQSENFFGYICEPFQFKWSIPARLGVFTLGVLGLSLSSRLKGVPRKVLALFGASSIIRASTNLNVTDLFGWIVNPVIRLRRTILINAPIEDVFSFLSTFSNYPKFMSYIQKVEVNELGGLRWIVKGPGGVLIHWNTTLAKLIRNEEIAWRSSIDSIIRNSGDIRLESLSNESTLVTVELVYAPPVGALGYAVAHFLGFDPKEKIDEDLQVLKGNIEKIHSKDQELIRFYQIHF